jgi:hypothetical protein
VWQAPARRWCSAACGARHFSAAGAPAAGSRGASRRPPCRAGPGSAAPHADEAPTDGARRYLSGGQPGTGGSGRPKASAQSRSTPATTAKIGVGQRRGRLPASPAAGPRPPRSRATGGSAWRRPAPPPTRGLGTGRPRRPGPPRPAQGPGFLVGMTHPMIGGRTCGGRCWSATTPARGRWSRSCQRASRGSCVGTPWGSGGWRPPGALLWGRADGVSWSVVGR